MAAFTMRLGFLCFLTLLTPRSTKGAIDNDIRFDTHIQPLLEEYCYRCHGNEKQKGDVRLSDFHDKRMILDERKLWQEALELVKNEEMPEEEPLPTPEERALIVSWLEQTLNELDWSKVKNPGHITMPRLTKVEYNNTLRDLTGVDIKPGKYFSEDGEGQSGFTNDRDALFITPVLMDKYFEAAERSIDTLLSFKKTPIQYHYESEDMFMTETRETPKRFDDDFFGYVINRGQMTLYESIDFPHTGIYEFRARARSTEGPTGFRIRINDEIKGDVEIYSEDPSVYAITAFMPKGSHQVAYNIQVPPVIYEPKPEIEKDSSNTPTESNKSKEKPQSVAIDWIEIQGPIRPEDASPKPMVFIAEPDENLSANEAAFAILRPFLKRAFRRPVTESEVRRYYQLYEEAASAGQTFDDSIKLALTAILVSPHFLFRPELALAETEEEYRITDYQLASRLSYFLWMTMPDQELFELAETNRLHKPRVLRKQVDRMLADPRASLAMEAFLGQWLGFESLGEAIQPDAKIFPEFTPALEKAMKAETRMVFDRMIRDGQSLTTLLDAEDTFLNDLLARHYGIDGIEGDEMRSVALGNRTRGGLLGMASVLTATSNPGRTNPVSRGKWVLETLLGDRIPEPPADAGILPENAGRVEGRTLREEFEQHRRNPSCVDCHQKIDPIGFGLENFDAIGRYRETENGVPIDSRGEMPGGIQFRGPVELKDYILSQRKESFVRNITERMLAFALGRELKHYDEPAIRKIIDALEKSRYNTRTLIKEIALSYPFQYQHPNPDYD